MDIHEALYTTRSMRRLRSDPIPHEVQARILDAAFRAPSAPDARRFLLVDDPELRRQLGALYLAASERFIDPSMIPPQLMRVYRSGVHLARHYGEVPLLLIGFERGTSGSSILPALWSAMLAARAEGVGSTLTTIMGLYYAAEVLELLGVPKDEGWHMAACVTMGYPTGRWDVAPRPPAHEVAFRNRWDTPLGFEVPEPLWPHR